jgi:hypothetical protein
VPDHANDAATGAHPGLERFRKANEEKSMACFRFLMFLCASLLSISAYAGLPAGTWKFESSVDYFGRTPVNKPPQFATIVVRNDEVNLSETCMVRVSRKRYSFTDVFQSLTKQGITETQVDAFLVKHFNISLLATKIMYSLGVSTQNEPRMLEFFLVKDKILVPVGVTFYMYARAKDEVAAVAPASSLSSTATASGYKLTPLPMDYSRFSMSCVPKIRDKKGNPHRSDKCAPDFFPYVAHPKSIDPIMKLVGNHDYAKGGEFRYSADFSPPFKQNVPATFLVFAPMRDVSVVFVDDLAVVRNEARDVMSPVYLSIVGGKIVDQISGCSLGRDYVCSLDGRKVAKLLPNGKFQNLIGD